MKKKTPKADRFARIPATLKLAIYTRLLQGVQGQDDDSKDAAAGKYVCDLAREGDGYLLACFLRELAEDDCRVPPDVLKFIADVFEGVIAFKRKKLDSAYFLKMQRIRQLLKRVDEALAKTDNKHTKKSLIENECKRDQEENGNSYIEVAEVERYLRLPEYRRLGITKEEYDIIEAIGVNPHSDWWNYLKDSDCIDREFLERLLKSTPSRKR